MAAQVPPRSPPFLLEFEELLQFFTFNCIEKCSKVLKEKKKIFTKKSMVLRSHLQHRF